MEENRNDMYEELYRGYFTPLYRYVFFRIKDKEVSNDIVQNIFLKFLQQKNDGEKDHNIRLLFVIARTTLIDHYRTNAKRRHQSLEEGNIDPPTELPDPEADFRSKEDIAKVKEALGHLSPIEEEIVVMRMTSDMKYKEIGKLLEMTEESVRQIYSRSLKKLGNYLEQFYLYE